MIKVVGLFCLLIVAVSCTSNTKEHFSSSNYRISETKEDSITDQTHASIGDYIRYGFSFGMCSGYCFTEVTIEASQITTIRKAWNDTINNPPKKTIAEFSPENWEVYNESIDFNKFRKLPKVFGCPDCTDGGAGWIEISRSKVVHKVTYDFQNPPIELQKILQTIKG